MIPFYVAPVTLTTVLTLTTSQHDIQEKGESFTSFTTRGNEETSVHYQDTSSINQPGLDCTVPESTSRTLYYISAQNDLYQTSEFIKFIMPFSVGTTLVLVWHCFATLFSVLGAIVLWPITFAEEIGVLPVSRKT